MAKITWLGEGDDGPEETEGFKGMKFKKGEAVDCDDPAILATASTNKYFKVEGYDAAEKPAETPTWPPPSQQASQHAVPKGGEPVDTEHMPEDQSGKKWPKI